MQGSTYLVFRVYSDKERPEKNSQSIFYGWTTHKSVIKIFLKQRSPKKYKVIKMMDEDIEKYFNDSDNSDWHERSYRIDYMKLKSAKTGDEYSLFVTLQELRQVEINIQGLFHDLASVSAIDGESKYLNMVYNLHDVYFETLYFLGYRPPEIEALFQDDMEQLYEDPDVEDQINDAYDDAVTLTPEDYCTRTRNMLPGQYFLSDISNKILYSIESFIKVMKDDM